MILVKTKINSSLDDLIWNKYDAEDRKTLEIAKDKIIEVNDPLKKRREALAPLVKYMINPGAANVNFDMSIFTKTKSVISAALNSRSTLVSEKIID